jgi:hypothetical protein
MALQLFFAPITGTGTDTDPRVVKYATAAPVIVGNWGMMDFGVEPWCIVGLDNTLNPTLAAQPDVVAIPVNLDGNVTAGEITKLTVLGTTAKIPMSWVTLQMTRRQVLRRICGIFAFAQRVAGLFGVSPFAGGITLATTWSQLTGPQQTVLLQVAQDLGYDTSGATGATTIGTILTNFGVQFGQKQLVVGGMTI